MLKNLVRKQFRRKESKAIKFGSRSITESKGRDNFTENFDFYGFMFGKNYGIELLILNSYFQVCGSKKLKCYFL
jgi:hypothetical protein